MFFFQNILYSFIFYVVNLIIQLCCRIILNVKSIHTNVSKQVSPKHIVLCWYFTLINKKRGNGFFQSNTHCLGYDKLFFALSRRSAVQKRLTKNMAKLANHIYGGMSHIIVEHQKPIFCCILTLILRSGTLSIGYKIHICGNFSLVLLGCLTSFFHIELRLLFCILLSKNLFS